MTTINPVETLRETIRKHHLIHEGALVVLGVSGGTDSLALLHILHHLGYHLHAATLDHGLRGDAGADDARFVVETAQAWGIPVTAGSADVRALAQEWEIGIEAAARMARYDFLASVASAVGVARIVVAHNADDQVETILFHLLRGSGLSGLAGMAYSAPLPGYPDLTLIRPLLDVPRAMLDAYCREQGLQPRHDATNEDTTYTRNRLRREALPYLRGLSPQIDRNLRQLAEIAASENDFADSALHEAVDAHIVREDGRIRLPPGVFANLHPTLQRRFIVWAARTIDPSADVAYIHITAAVELALRGQVGARAQFRGAVQLRNDYRWVIIERTNLPVEDDRPLITADLAIPISIPGVTRLKGNWSLQASLTPLEGEAAQLAVPEGSEIVLRGRRAGDLFRTRYTYGFSGWGSGIHTKKLAAWMIDHQVPRHLRERIPLLIINGVVAALYWNGWTISDQFTGKTHDARLLYFQISDFTDHQW